MKMKTYQADTMQEALVQIKDELGPEAVILRTRKSTRSLLGRKRDCIEVTAALEDSLYAKPDDAAGEGPSKPVKGVYGRSCKLGPDTSEKNNIMRDTGSEVMDYMKIEFNELKNKLGAPQVEIKTMQKDLGHLLQEMGRLKSTIDRIDLDAVAPEFEDVYRCLLEADFDEDLARELIRNLANVIPVSKRHDPEIIRRRLHKMLTNRLYNYSAPAPKPGRPIVIMVVGPTGVGKTTTIAKLAGIHKLEKGQKVGIISADTYRMGAIQQMEVFCQTADIPLETVFGKDDAVRALQSLSDRDIIFIDTAGRFQADNACRGGLQDLVSIIQPDEVHLVLSCTTRGKDMLNACRQYNDIGYQKLIFTKLDETLTIGCIYNISCDIKMPVSFLCNGQEIPDSIIPADRETLASMILEDICFVAV